MLRYKYFLPFVSMLCVFTLPGMSEDHLIPVDGRIGRWNTTWQHLVSHMPKSPGYIMVSILVEPPTGQSWMIYVKGRHDESCIVHAARFTAPPLPNENLDNMKVSTVSKTIDGRLVELINKHFVNLLLKTRYKNDVDGNPMLDGNLVYVGATDEGRYGYLSGREIIEKVPQLAWILQTADALSLFAKGDLSADELERIVKDKMPDEK
jgi:hypothetical protein